MTRGGLEKFLKEHGTVWLLPQTLNNGAVEANPFWGRKPFTGPLGVADLRLLPGSSGLFNDMELLFQTIQFMINEGYMKQIPRGAGVMLIKLRCKGEYGNNNDSNRGDRGGRGGARGGARGRGDGRGDNQRGDDKGNRGGGRGSARGGARGRGDGRGGGRGGGGGEHVHRSEEQGGERSFTASPTFRGSGTQGEGGAWGVQPRHLHFSLDSSTHHTKESSRQQAGASSIAVTPAATPAPARSGLWSLLRQGQAGAGSTNSTPP